LTYQQSAIELDGLKHGLRLLTVKRFN